MKKISKYVTYFFIAISLLVAIIYGVSLSDFTKIRKYDEPEKKHKEIPITKEKQQFAKAHNYNTKIKVQENGLINLGDFTMNLADNKMLIANISIKYRDDSEWYSLSAEQENFSKKSSVLRNAVIRAMYKTTASTNDAVVKARIKNSLNSYLHDGEVEAVYFNKFIIQ